MENIVPKERVAWIDIARGWAMILVVLAHTHIPAKLSSYIYSFHVPLFFILSGFLLHDRLDKPWPEFIKSKFTSLVIPYFFFSFIAYGYWLFIRNTGLDSSALAINASVPLNGTFLAIRGGDFMTHNAALWFICSLFLSEIAFYAIYRLVKGDRTLLGIALLISGILGMLYNTFIQTALPWSIDTVPIVVVFIGFGFFLKHYSYLWINTRRTKRNSILLLLCILAVSFAAWQLNNTPVGSVDMFYSIYGNFALYFTAALAGSLAVILLFQNFITRSKPLLYIGQNSLIIYALHQKVIFGIIAIAFAHTFGSTMPFTAQSSLEKLGNGLTYLILALLLLMPIIWLTNTYASQYAGKGNRKSISRK
jgi:fucose 4-O-acetylase-like acetyltransferase